MTEKISRGSFRSLCMTIALLGTAWFATAQEPVKLTLKDAVSYALKENQTARKSRLDVENAQYQIDEVRSRALPQISGSASLLHNAIQQLTPLPNIFGPNPNPNETILVTFGQKWSTNAGISLNQNLFDKSVFTGLKAAKTTREFYQLNAQLTEEQIIEQVATTYYQVLVQRQQAVVIDSALENSKRVQSILQSLFENGLAKKIDVDRISVNISNLANQRLQLTNGITIQENQLKFLIGMPLNTPISIPDIQLGSIQPVAALSDDTVSLRTRSEYKLLAKQFELLNFQKEAYKAEYYPTLGLSSNYSYQGTGNSFPLGKGKTQGVNWFDFASISLNLKIPIFNGFATKARIKQADVSMRKLEEDINNTSLALNLAFENAKTQMNNSIITLKSQEANVKLAEEVFSNTQNNYNNGLASLTDLLDAERSLTESRNSYSTSLLNYKVAEIQLLKSKGELKSIIN